MFKPLREAHAISEMVAFIQFARPFDHDALSKMMKLKHALRKDLPRCETLQTVTATVDMQKNAIVTPESYTQKLGGITFERIATNGEVQWALRIIDDVVAVHCLEYTRWEEVWRKSRKYLSSTIQYVDFSRTPVSAIGLKYVDKFIFDRSKENYDASLLIRRDSNLVAPIIFSQDELWHSHCGWFENYGKEGRERILNQCKVGTIYENNRHITTIDHNAIVHFSHLDIDPLGVEGRERPLLDELMEKLHAGNKRLLQGILTDQMCKRIRLLEALDEM